MMFDSPLDSFFSSLVPKPLTYKDISVWLKAEVILYTLFLFKAISYKANILGFHLSPTPTKIAMSLTPDNADTLA